jgi:hypothetical protein
MIINNITDIKRFFEVVNKCKGRVELVTADGDRLNLKSTLCQYVGLTDMFTEAKIDNVEILASEPEDLHLLMEFLIRG